MRKVLTAGGAGILAALALAALAAAADPTPAPTPIQAQARARDAAPAVLGLSADQIQELRQEGLSLAQIAERQNVDPQKLVEALTERWTERIDARAANGALSAEQAAALKAQLQERATAMVQQEGAGGMAGAAVGAGPRAGGSAAGSLGAGAQNGAGPQAAAGSSTAGAGFGQGAGAPGSGSGTCDGTGPHGAGGR